MPTTPSVTNLPDAVSSLAGHWQPKAIGTVNGSHSLKVARIQGAFVWHAHPDTDEVFYCVSGGPMVLELADAASNDERVPGGVTRHRLGVGDVFTVPRGRRHRPVADRETGVLLIEKIGTVNTGDAQGDEARERTFHVKEDESGE